MAEVSATQATRTPGSPRTSPRTNKGERTAPLGMVPYDRAATPEYSAAEAVCEAAAPPGSQPAGTQSASMISASTDATPRAPDGASQPATPLPPPLTTELGAPSVFHSGAV